MANNVENPNQKIFTICDLEPLDAFAIVPEKTIGNRKIVAMLFESICKNCPVVQECKPVIVITPSECAIVMGEQRDTEDCEYAQIYTSKEYNGKIAFNIEDNEIK